MCPSDFFRAVCWGFVRDVGFEPTLLAYEASGVPNSPNPVCACRDTPISAGSHFVGASGEVLRFPSGYQEAWRGWVRTSIFETFWGLMLCRGCLNPLSYTPQVYLNLQNQRRFLR